MVKGHKYCFMFYFYPSYPIVFIFIFIFKNCPLIMSWIYSKYNPWNIFNICLLVTDIIVDEKKIDHFINWTQISHLGNVIVATEGRCMVLEKLSIGFSGKKTSHDWRVACQGKEKDSMFKSKYSETNKGKNYKEECRE